MEISPVRRDSVTAGHYRVVGNRGRRLTDEQIEWVLRALRSPANNDADEPAGGPNVVDLAEWRRTRRTDNRSGGDHVPRYPGAS